MIIAIILLQPQKVNPSSMEWYNTLRSREENQKLKPFAI